MTIPTTIRISSSSSIASDVKRVNKKGFTQRIKKALSSKSKQEKPESWIEERNAHIITSMFEQSAHNDAGTMGTCTEDSTDSSFEEDMSMEAMVALVNDIRASFDAKRTKTLR